MGKSTKIYFVIRAALSQIGHFSSALLSDTKSVTPIYFFEFRKKYFQARNWNVSSVGRF